MLLMALILAGGAVAGGVSVASGARPEASTPPSASANRASATTAAARLLTLIALPPGAAASATEPADDQGRLSEPTDDQATPNLVDAHAWWTTTASPQAVLAYVAAHLPAGATASGQSSFSGPAGTVASTSETFALSPVAGVLAQREIGVTTASLPHGVTGIRTDGEAVWLTPRPAWEQIPSGVDRVVFTARGADDQGRVGRASAPRTLRGARAQRLVALLNAAEVVQPGVRACPLGIEQSVVLRFLANDGATLARATENSSGCAFVRLTIGTRTGPLLNDYPSVGDELLRLGAVPVCAGRALSASVSPPGRNGPVNARLVSFSFENRSTVMCRLAGFPRLAVFDAAGRRLALTVRHLGAASIRREGLSAASILDPGQSAGFAATYSLCRAAPHAVSAQVRLPGVARRFRFAVGTARQPVAVCRGTVGVGNL